MIGISRLGWGEWGKLWGLWMGGRRGGVFRRGVGELLFV